MPTFSSTHHTTQHSASTVARALAAQAEDVAAALLGAPTESSRHEQRWGRRGSLSMRRSGEKRGLWFNHESGQGGDLLDLVAHEHGVRIGEAIRIAERDLLGGGAVAMAAIPERVRQPKTLVASAVEDTEKALNREWALRLWSETVPLAGTLGERYLIAHRKLDIRTLDLGHVLRWHARKNMLVALMTDPTSDTLNGIHRTFLDADGAKIDPRKMLGRQGTIRLSPNASVTMGLGLTEGVEDGLAVLLSGWGPVWAATSAGAIARFPVLEGVEALTIFADADAPGIKDAETCRARWQAADREARIVAPERGRA